MATSLGSIIGQVRLDIKNAVAGYAALRAQNQRTVYAMRGTSESFIGAGKTMTIAGAAGVYAFSKMVLAAAEFERKMDFASAVSGATGEQIQQLSDYALKLGQDTIYSAGQIADGFIELAKAGVTAEEIMTGVGEAMTSLGAAADIPLDQAGQIIVSSLSQFNKPVSDAARMVDILAGAANASIADITDLGVSLKYTGGIAKQNNQSFMDTSTALALLANAGIRGSTAGTSMRQMLVSLPGVTGPAKEALKEMGIVTEDGSNKFYDMQGNLKPLPKVFQILQDSLAGFSNEQKTVLLRQLFNNRALGAAVELTEQGAKGFKKMRGEISKVKASEVASERLDNLSGDIEILRGNIETLIIQQGGPFQKTMRQWVQGLTKLVQAFGALDPGTQEAIVQSIAVGSAMLVAMGAISIIIGTIARFIASMLKMAAGMKFLWNMLKIVITNLKWLRWIIAGPIISAITGLAAALGISVGALLAIIAVIAAVVVGLVVLYKKWTPFRSMIDGFAAGVWNAIKAVGAFFKALVTDPAKAWAMLKAGLSNMGSWFAQVGKWIWNGLKSGLTAIARFVARAVTWFFTLPIRIVAALASMAGDVAKSFSFAEAANAVGGFIATVVKFFALLPLRIWAFLIKTGLQIISFFLSLAPRAGYALGLLVGKVLGFFIRMGIQITLALVRMGIAIVNFFRTLPQRIATFLTIMAAKAIMKFQELRRKAPIVAAQMVNAVVNFIKSLPDRVGDLIQRMVTVGIAKFQRFRERAREIADNLKTGFVNGIKDLPSTVSGILQDVIAAFNGVVRQAFDAAKNFAKGLWDGFKDGLGINSPSYIEHAAWDITKVLDEETKKMAARTAEIQALSRRMATTQFAVGDPGAVSAAESYVALASMQSRNQKRAGKLAANSGKGSGSAASRTASSGAGGEIPFRITNWSEGTGMMEDVVEDYLSDENDYEDTMGRMRR